MAFCSTFNSNKKGEWVNCVLQQVYRSHRGKVVEQVLRPKQGKEKAPSIEGEIKKPQLTLLKFIAIN